MYQCRFVGLMILFSLVVESSGCGTRIPGLDPDADQKLPHVGDLTDRVVVEITDYHPPKPVSDELTDDRLEEKQTSFVAELVDRRPLEGWLVNQTEAVIRLDIPLAKPDRDQHLLVLHPSYSVAVSTRDVLPSVNLIDGKAKQFDDGLYAAIDLALFQGVADKRFGHIRLIQRLLAAVDQESSAAAYLAAGLTLGGIETEIAKDSERLAMIRKFEETPALSKPIGFYTWNESLVRCWQFMRFFQTPLNESDPVVGELATALQADPELASECQRAAQFYARLTNPLTRLTISDLIEADVSSSTALDTLRSSRGIALTETGASLFPASTSRETELFKKLFPVGVPDGADLMRELIRRIRSGEVDLTPRENSGWYDHQVYALETMLLPELGDEHHKLLLTKPYKKRMLEAFQALITKRRETHVRQGDVKTAASARPSQLESISPRLRIEPCPSYYLRTARSYAFLQSFLIASLGEETLKQLHGLRKEGNRPDDLASELSTQRDLFYGLYFVSCDDIGHPPTIAADEVTDPNHCYEAALAWLKQVAERADPDLAVDTRVAVPIYVDPIKNTTRLWVTLGVRLTRLETSYVRPPRIKPANETGEWEVVTPDMLENADYLIAVDEFGEVEIPTLAPPTREELRQLCDAQKTKEKILEALSTWK